jgi:hypothetical protein
VRFQFAGMSFLVSAEAKLHKNPIKRELVQVLHQKMQSTGVQKGVIFSTSSYQTGAVAFARTHGIALARVIEGESLYETRDALPAPQFSRREAGLPAFVAQYYGAGDKPDSIRSRLLSPDEEECSRHVAELLLGRPHE